MNAPVSAVPDSTFGDDSPARASLPDWKQQLGALRQKTRAALERLSEYLHLRRPASADPALSGEIGQHLAATLETLSMRQDSLETMLQATSELHATNDPDAETKFARGKRSDDPPAWAVQLQSMVADRLDAFESALHAFGDRSVARPSDPDGFDGPATDDDTFIQSDMLPVVAAGGSASADDDTLSVMLGPTLCGAAELSPAIRWLTDNVRAGNPQALALVGQLLVFRCAPPERKPSLLKDVGEAYYRCFPKTRDARDPFEDAIAAWSRQHCDEAGLPNSVELVHPGERFDAARHSPVERGGVEVAEVLGWVVLRDGGRVYSKALVQTR